MSNAQYNDLVDENGRAIHVSLLNNSFLSIEARPLTPLEGGGMIQPPEDMITISVEKVPELVEQIMSMLRRREPPFFDLANEVCGKWREAFLLLVNYGEITTSYEEHIGCCNHCCSVIQKAFEQQAEALEELGRFVRAERQRK